MRPGDWNWLAPLPGLIQRASRGVTRPEPKSQASPLLDRAKCPINEPLVPANGSSGDEVEVGPFCAEIFKTSAVYFCALEAEFTDRFSQKSRLFRVRFDEHQ